MLYRSRQFFVAWGRLNLKDEREARQVLGPRLYSIFAAMPRQYRLHSLQVYRRVLASGCHDPHICQAALLHDSGKYYPSTRRSVTILHRVAIVLLNATPQGGILLDKLAAKPGATGLSGYLLYPFYLSKHHAKLGAALAGEHGATEEVIQLIADHHKPSGANPALSALQAADEHS